MQARQLDEERARAAVRRRDAGFVVSPPDGCARTARNRRAALAALAIAGLVLLVFNSGALVHYAHGLIGYPAGTRILIATENWHRMMQRRHLAGVAESIRRTVAELRRSDWDDLAPGPAAIAERERPGPYTSSIAPARNTGSRTAE